jgi:hypothetical protein
MYNKNKDLTQLSQRTLSPQIWNFWIPKMTYSWNNSNQNKQGSFVESGPWWSCLDKDILINRMYVSQYVAIMNK